MYIHLNYLDWPIVITETHKDKIEEDEKHRDDNRKHKNAPKK
tara:strand:+ start:3923 stop:4048 length:126 start_codon:yes stop_codon:yes gene_type:complete